MCPLDDDSLVNLRGRGIGGWFSRIGRTIARSWKILLPIFGLTHALPTMMLGVFVLAGANAQWTAVLILERDGSVQDRSIVALLAFGLLVLLLNLLGYAAATYAATRQAAGLPVTLGHALGYGARRSFGLLGRQLMACLMVAVPVGLVLVWGINLRALIYLTIPVLAYLAATIALVGPAYLFERRNAIARSIGLLHSALWPVVGRLSLLFVSMAAFSLIENTVAYLGFVAGNDSGPDARLPYTAVSMLVVPVVGIVFTMVLFSGILGTYVERRAEERRAAGRRLSSRDLAAELG